MVYEESAGSSRGRRHGMLLLTDISIHTSIHFYGSLFSDSQFPWIDLVSIFQTDPKEMRYGSSAPTSFGVLRMVSLTYTSTTSSICLYIREQ
jgi:hypothetical protein